MRASLIGLLLLACAPIDLSAGVGPVGKSPGEPNGLEEVRIVRENLEIDLRSLTDGKGIGSVDVEFGFSCMGYEIAGGWGAKIAQAETNPTGETVVFVGDGSYLLMNSDLYSSVLSRHKLIVCVLDNGGFAVINKLQRNTGNASFNTLFADCPTIPDPIPVDFAAHARAMGCIAEEAATLDEIGRAHV